MDDTSQILISMSFLVINLHTQYELFDLTIGTTTTTRLPLLGRTLRRGPTKKRRLSESQALETGEVACFEKALTIVNLWMIAHVNILHAIFLTVVA